MTKTIQWRVWRRPHTAGFRLATALLLAAGTAQAQGTITGRVTDARSTLPLSGVALEVEGTRLGAMTDSTGQYRINGVSSEAHTLIARRIGYASLRRTTSVTSGQPVTVDFALVVSATMLDQVVVTGTAGGELRRSIGNAVATVDASDMLAKSAATNLSSLLNARAPGINIVPTSGRVGAGPAIQIRGRSSIGLSNNPLLYIDGVRANNNSGTGPVAVTGGFAGQGSQVGGRLNDINPDDIESIEVISGPAAATIYGTEAASGVIQIITKRGRSGDKPAMSFRMETGSLYFRDAENRIEPNYARNGTDIVVWNGVKQEADSGRPLFRTGLTRRYIGTASGGQSAMRYYASGAYENDYGIEKNNAMRQLTSRVNLSNSFGQSTEMSTSLSYVQKSEHLGADQGASTMFGVQFGHPRLYPNIPAARGFNPGFPPEVPQTLYDNAVGVNRFTGSTTFNNRSIAWLAQKATVGVDYTTEDARGIERFAPPELAALLPAAVATGRIGQTLRRNTIVTADYSGTAKFNLTSSIASSSSIGGQYYNTESNSSFLGGSGFPAPNVETVSSVANGVGSSQTQTINTTIGAYGQQQFSWRDRLYLTAALRVDNNSAFGDDFKWVTYPKFSLSWIASEESWWPLSGTINTLRLRSAYGESGRQPTAFSALRTFAPVTGASAITPGSIGNPDLKPERGKEIEMGVEANLWNRLDLNFTYFNKHTYDAILNQAVAPSSGFSASRPMNLGRVDNHGFEAQATLQAFRSNRLSWEVTGNLGTNNDKIVSLGGVPSVITAYGPTNVEGYPVQGLWSRVVVAAFRNPTTGLADSLKCDNGSGGAMGCVSTVANVPSAPFRYIGTQTPKVTGAIANTLNIGKRLRLFALADFKTGHKALSTAELLRCSGLAGLPLCRANYYPNEYDIKYIAENTTAAINGGYVDQYYTSASFWKLREVSATYNIPERWVRGVQSSFTLAARELFTKTDFRGLDPEAFIGTSDQAVTPPLNRIIATFTVKW
jgi:TonB-linked SusC/RagA family outer membrane protein